MPGGKTKELYPFICAIINIDGEKLGSVEFLIDTGSGVTVISAKDAMRIGINQIKGKLISITGIAGGEKCPQIRKDIDIIFIDSEDQTNILAINTDKITYRLLPHKHRGKQFQEQFRVPSLLGWDIMSKLKITLDYANNTVELCKQ